MLLRLTKHRIVFIKMGNDNTIRDRWMFSMCPKYFEVRGVLSPACVSENKIREKSKGSLSPSFGTLCTFRENKMQCKEQ